VTTATAPRVSEETLEVVWRTITRDVQRFSDTADIGTVNSKRWERIQGKLEELAAMLVDEVPEHETESLVTMTEGIWKDIHDRMIGWALSIETARVERQTGAAS
jgi:hypothetical protein